MLITGYAAGPHWRRQGGGTNQLCLPEEPQLQNHTKRRMHSGWLYGIEYRTGGDPGGTTAYHANPIPCVVCYVPQRSALLMIPASNTCPVGWTREYDGYLMSDYSWGLDHTTPNRHHGTSYICVDSAPKVASGAIDRREGELYFVRVGCGTLPCSKFTEGLNLPCVVCTKWIDNYIHWCILLHMTACTYYARIGLYYTRLLFKMLSVTMNCKAPFSSDITCENTEAH